MTHHDVPFLTLLILLPAIGAAVLGLFGLDKRMPKELSYAVALIASLATLGFAIATLVVMKVHDGGFQLVSDHDYTGNALGVHWYLGVDGISIFLVLLTAILFPLTIILGRHRENHRAYCATAARGAGHGELVARLSCSSSCSSHARCRPLRPSPAGGTSAGPTRYRGSSSTRSALPSCSSGSWPSPSSARRRRAT